VADSDDILSDVLTALYAGGLAQFRGQTIGEVIALLKAVVRNRAIDFLKERNRWAPTESSAERRTEESAVPPAGRDPFDVSSGIADEECVEFLRQEVAKLKQEDRELFLMKARGLKEREIVEQTDNHAKMLTHRAKHPQRKFRALSEKIDKIPFRNEQHRARFSRARICRITAFRGQRRFGKRFDWTKNMDHLFFSAGANAMNIDRAFLHDVKTFAPIAFTKKIVALVEMLGDNKRPDRRNVSGRQADEKLATAKNIFDDDLSELCRFHRHGRKLSGPLLSVAPKNCTIQRRLRENNLGAG